MRFLGLDKRPLAPRRAKAHLNTTSLGRGWGAAPGRGRLYPRIPFVSKGGDEDVPTPVARPSQRAIPACIQMHRAPDLHEPQRAILFANDSLVRVGFATGQNLRKHHHSR
jgi:hypothetical protein